MASLSSSCLSRAEYNPATRQLDVWFHSSSRAYSHYNVPLSVYEGLLRSSSPGSYYRNYIKGYY